MSLSNHMMINPFMNPKTSESIHRLMSMFQFMIKS